MDQLRTRLDAYCAARERALYHFYSGDERRLDLDRLDDTYGDITDGAALTRAVAERERASEPWKVRWSPLVRTLETILIGGRTRRVRVDLAQREAAQRNIVGDTERATFTWWRRRGATTDAVERRRIQVALEAAWAELNPIRCELWAHQTEVVRELGHDTMGAWFDSHQPNVDRKIWVGLATRFLEATEVPYYDRLNQTLRTLGVDPRRAHAGDLAHIARLDRFADVFPPKVVFDGIDFTLDGLGDRLDDLDIKIDVERRTGKYPRALCFSPAAPGEQFISIGLRGGVGDLRVLLHRLGTALAYTYVSPSLDVELRRAIDPVLLETWGLLLRNRVADPAWIALGPPARSGEAFARDLGFIHLLELRTLAAQVRWEAALVALPAGEDPTELTTLYSDEMLSATGAQHRPTTAMVGHELRASALNRFRAACFEQQLSEHLRLEFGERFFRERGAFSLLKELWNTGGTYSADDVAAELGLGTIGLERLLTQVFK